MNFSICLDAVYQGVPIRDAIADVKAHGFSVVERWVVPADQLKQTRDALTEFGVGMSAICTDFFILTDPTQRDAYMAGLESALEKAKALSCDQLITQVGNDTGAPRAQQHKSIVEGLKKAVPLLEKAGVTLLVEPLNTVKNHPGYYLSSSEEGFDIINEVDSANVRLLFDVYHQLHMGEDAARQAETHLPLIEHFHIAGFPARDEQLFSGYDYKPLLYRLDELHNHAYIGVELSPSNANARDALLNSLRALT